MWIIKDDIEMDMTLFEQEADIQRDDLNTLYLSGQYS